MKYVVDISLDGTAFPADDMFLVRVFTPRGKAIALCEIDPSGIATYVSTDDDCLTKPYSYFKGHAWKCFDNREEFVAWTIRQAQECKVIP